MFHVLFNTGHYRTPTQTNALILREILQNYHTFALFFLTFFPWIPLNDPWQNTTSPQTCLGRTCQKVKSPENHRTSHWHMKLGTLGSPRSQIGKNQKPGGFKKLGRGFSPNLELYRIRGDFQDLFLEKMETCTPIEILIHIFPFQIWWMLWSSFFQILRSAKRTSRIQKPIISTWIPIRWLWTWSGRLPGTRAMSGLPEISTSRLS